MGQLPDRGVRSWLAARPVVFGGAFLALLLVLGGGSFLLATSSGSESPAQTASAAGEEYDTSRVANEEVDPAALEPETLFEPTEIEVANVIFERVVTDDTEDCAAVAHGSYGEVLVENDCRQVVRSSYVSDDHAVTVGVAALPSQDAAEQAEASRDVAATDWFAGLAGPEDSGAERLEYAGGHAHGAVWGRYLVFALASGQDGSSPEDADSELDEISEEFLQVPLTALGERARD
ncbi:hypothetical protein RIF23_06405 [Lipingzhangella sp. LS1_29]|uniref:Uncharacterized protein n=1 Tax=Lipingzhangella rawalii TaxID=2055835 RepID=A0ABU2H3P2_9ACTN|nr:hypothetical protein [Lipingzhangella rawalii]MDS1269924.1 hypothetical protein [Lipingzhangella rawalii]